MVIGPRINPNGSSEKNSLGWTIMDVEGVVLCALNWSDSSNWVLHLNWLSLKLHDLKPKTLLVQTLGSSVRGCNHPKFCIYHLNICWKWAISFRVRNKWFGWPTQHPLLQFGMSLDKSVFYLKHLWKVKTNIPYCLNSVLGINPVTQHLFM